MTSKFDVFISYQWDIKPSVHLLHKYLNQKGLTVWLDDFELGTSNLYDHLAEGIKNSQVFMCCITAKYIESANCRREIEYASTLNKDFIVLMYDRLNIEDIGGVGIIINPFVRINCYKFSTVWLLEHFDSILFKIRNLLPNKKAQNIESDEFSLVTNKNNTPKPIRFEFRGVHNTTLYDHTNQVTCLCSLNEHTLASGSKDETIKLWNLANGTLKHTLVGHTDTVNTLCRLSNEMLASGSRDETIKIWNSTSGKLVKTINDLNDSILCMCNLNDTAMAVGLFDNSIKIFELKSFGLLKSLYGHEDSVTAVCGLGNSLLMASGSKDATIKIWNPNEGVLLRTLHGHEDSVLSVCFSSGLLISGSNDESIKIWNADKGLLLKTLTAHSDSVSSVVALAGIFASCSDDKKIIIWDLNEGKILNEISVDCNHGKCLQYLNKYGLASAFENSIKIWN